MERYTSRNKQGDLMLCGEQVYGNNQNVYNALSELEEYEDTDLTPDEIVQMRREWRDTEKNLRDTCIAYQDTGLAPAEVSAFARAKQEGRLVVLNPKKHPSKDETDKPKCFYTELPSQYWCRGYCHGDEDDEPIDACKNCWWCDGNEDFREAASAEKERRERDAD